jgi:hypothetical protein
VNLLSIVFLVSSTFAARPQSVFLPSCDNSQQISPAKKEIREGLKAIPRGLLVAREAYFNIQSTDVGGTPVKIRSYQSFMKSNGKPRARILCGDSETPLRNRFSMMAPTLIDNKSASNPRHIFWQFQVLAEDSILSPWNTRSIALQNFQHVDKTMDKLGYETKVYQISQQRYEITYEQKSIGKIETLSVVYDLD